MTEPLKLLLEILKLAPRYVAAIGLAAAVLVFGNEELLETFGVLQFAEDQRATLGAIVIFAGCLAAVSSILWVVRIVDRHRAAATRQRDVKKYLHVLTEDEKQILRHYVREQTRTNFLRITDGVVQGLVAKGIIRRAARMGHLTAGFAYNITDVAWQYLNENQWLLEGSTFTSRNDLVGDPLNKYLG